jgi:hypothetical protein
MQHTVGLESPFLFLASIHNYVSRQISKSSNMLRLTSLTFQHISAHLSEIGSGVSFSRHLLVLIKSLSVVVHSQRQHNVNYGFIASVANAMAPRLPALLFGFQTLLTLNAITMLLEAARGNPQTPGSGIGGRG